MEIRLSRPEDEPRLREIWKVCFGDEDPYLDLFFQKMYRPEDLGVVEESGKVQSMITMLPATLHTGTADYPVIYFYALGTDPANRGKGYAVDLIHWLRHIARERGNIALTLMPASESLFRFYERADYVTVFYYDLLDAAAVSTDEAEGTLTGITAEEYRALRMPLLPNVQSVECEIGFFQHQADVSEMFGGAVYRLDLPQGTGVAVVDPTEDGAWVAKELLVPQGAERTALALLKRELKTDHLTARVPVREGAGDVRKIGMADWLVPNPPELHNAYLGLALD